MIGLDQLTKLWVTSKLLLNGIYVVFNNFLSITYVENRGIAFSLLENRRLVFLPISIVLLLVLTYCFYRFKNRLLRIALLLIIGGAIGNFIDRIFKNGVVDFLQVHIGRHYSPIFNVADIFVISGSLLLIVLLLQNNEKLN